MTSAPPSDELEPAPPPAKSGIAGTAERPAAREDAGRMRRAADAAQLGRQLQARSQGAGVQLAWLRPRQQ